MNNSLKWRALVVIAVVALAVAYLLPTFTDSLPSWWTKKKVSLGLDLKGGIHLIMGVDLEVALKNTVSRSADELRHTLVEKKIAAVVRVAQKNGLIIESEFYTEAAMKEAEKLLSDDFNRLKISSRSGNTLAITLTEAEIAFIKKESGRQALETIRNRVDMFGVAEPDIRPQGEDRIVIQLPGMDDPQRAVALIGKTAQLEFKLVDGSPEEVERALKYGAPAGKEILFERRRIAGEKEEKIPYLLKKQSLMTGDDLIDARVTTDEMGASQVSITFNKRGARQFERVTGEHIYRNMAIVLDGMVYSAPTIQAKIGGGRAVITGSYSVNEARDLAVALRAGALPAPVTVLEERTVGPTLGSDSIDMGLKAGLVGIGLVVLFMAIYYRRAGLVADLALILNFPIILAVLAVFGATLTMPGIFGLILTLAMAVDSNVLIFERIREELRLGKSPHTAVGAGFSRAFQTILDSNVTSLLVALVLYQFGTGPIRGFAVTLSVGILSSMFTAIFMSRFIFDLALSRRQIKRLSI